MTNHEALEAVETIDSLSIRSRSSNRNPLSIRWAVSMRVIADLVLTQNQAIIARIPRPRPAAEEGKIVARCKIERLFHARRRLD
jgi:hypothetical protein